MTQLTLFIAIVLMSVTTFSRSVVLSPDNLSTALLKVSFEREVHLNVKNKFRFPVIIDSNNKCILTSLTPTSKKGIVLRENSEWISVNTSADNDFGAKSYSFKLVHSSGSFLMKCDLNLAGEILLFNTRVAAVEGKKAAALCTKQGGQLKGSALSYSMNLRNGKRAPASIQRYCVKQIPKVTLSRFKTAFQNVKLNVAVDFPAEEIM